MEKGGLIRTVVCATDFSAGAERPLSFALDLALRTGATLHLFYAYVHRRVYYPDELRDRLMGMIPDRPPGLNVHYHVDVGTAAAPCMLAYAEKTGADVLVLGTRCPQASSDGLLGDVTRKVLYHATCGVVTVDTRARGPDSRVEVSSVLAPVDCSDSSPMVVEQAARLAGIYGARLDLLHVISEPEVPLFYPGAGRSIIAEDPALPGRAEQALRALFEETGPHGVRADFGVRLGSPPEAILEEAKQRSCGLLFMATRSCESQAFLPTSNYTEIVARHAAVPVYTVKTALVSS